MKYWVYSGHQIIGWVIADSETNALKAAYEKYRNEFWLEYYSIKVDKR